MNKMLIAIMFCVLLLLLSYKPTLAMYEPLSVANNIYGIHITNLSDVEDAAKLVNNGGGDWGYITVVINQDNRHKAVWQEFFDNSRRLHLIPILRVATSSDGENWIRPNENDVDSWVNFFNSLNWVTENRYIIIGNEPNHAKEWGGEINPEEYGNYLKLFSERLNNANPDYFVLAAGFDQAAGNTYETMDEKEYLEKMFIAVPNAFNYVDGWNSHSYPNPDFSGPAKGSGRKSVKGYKWELDVLKGFGISREFPIFITETGWSNTNLSEDEIITNYKYAFEEVWAKDKSIVAVTPFILNYAQPPFENFSWKNSDGTYLKRYEELQKLSKTTGKPRQFINGKILFSYLSSTAIAGSETKGYIFVENTGQNIWDSKNSFIVSESGEEIKLNDITLKEIYPLTGKFIGYTLTYPKTEGEFDIKIGLYVEDKRIGEVFDGKVYTYISTESVSQNIIKRLSLIFSKVQYIRS